MGEKIEAPPASGTVSAEMQMRADKVTFGVRTGAIGGGGLVGWARGHQTRAPLVHVVC